MCWPVHACILQRRQAPQPHQHGPTGRCLLHRRHTATPTAFAAARPKAQPPKATSLTQRESHAGRTEGRPRGCKRSALRRTRTLPEPIGAPARSSLLPTQLLAPDSKQQALRAQESAREPPSERERPLRESTARARAATSRAATALFATAAEPNDKLPPAEQRGRITFDMSGMTRLAGACPLDGGVGRRGDQRPRTPTTSQCATDPRRLATPHPRRKRSAGRRPPRSDLQQSYVDDTSHCHRSRSPAALQPLHANGAF